MPYNQNIPAATDTLNVSQVDIQGNFQELYVDFGRNHVNFDGLVVADRGKHSFVTYPSLGNAPANEPAVIGATEMGMYNLVNATTGLNEIYIRRGAAATGYPLTAKSLAATRGFTYLPSGLVLKFGFGTAAGGVLAVNLNLTGPAFAGAIAPFVTIGLNTNAANKAVSFINLTNAGFDVQTGDPTANVYWMAIGAV